MVRKLNLSSDVQLDQELQDREIRRIKNVYKDRKCRGNGEYSNNFSFRRENEIISAIKKNVHDSFKNKIVLDIGCGEGAILKCFLSEGFTAKNLYGIDLSFKRIETAHNMFSNVSLFCGSADALPYKDASFDIITQSTVFTSILNTGMKKDIASEMLRILKPGGLIIWHDFRYHNLFNKQTSGIGKKEIKSLFPNCNFEFKLINLNPFVGRPLIRISKKLCNILEKIPFFRSHWLAVIKRNLLNK